MADSSNKVEENVEGDYYVDTDCISCQLCVAVAPDFFEMGDVYAYVSQQPDDDAGIAMCEDALEQCPVDSIGNDG